MNMEEVLKSFSTGIAAYARKQKEVLDKFKDVIGTVIKDGALSAKTKELIALGIGVALRCSYCIALHVEKLLSMGATEEEIMEACSVALFMGGGPAMTYISEVAHAIEAAKKKLKK